MSSIVKITLILLVNLVLSICINDILYVQNYDTGQFFCITDSPFALSWIYDNDTVNITSSKDSNFLPLFLSWNVSYDDIMEKKWVQKEELSDVIIVDRRWEKFQTSLLKLDEENNGEDFSSYLKKREFQIAFSAHVSVNAQIFNCKNKINQNCEAQFIKGYDIFTRPSGKCKQQRSDPCAHVVSKFQQLNGQFVTEAWNHFILQKKFDQIKLYNGFGKLVLTFKSSEYRHPLYPVYKLLKNDQDNFLLWKLHKLVFFFSGNTQTTELAGVITPFQGQICISMFLKMCKKCIFTIILVNKITLNLSTESFHGEKFSRWKKITFKMNRMDEHHVYFSTTNESDEESYWAIDDVKQCTGDAEFRIIESGAAGRCRLLSKNAEVVTSFLEGSTDQTQVQKNYCDENTIGKSCISCNSFLNSTNCGRIKVCQEFNNKLLCSCSAGYRRETGCLSPCDHGHYGHDCSKNCKTSCLRCDNVNGNCLISQFSVPKVLSTDVTEANIDSVNCKNALDIYAIEYKNLENDPDKWNLVQSKTNYIQTIKDLKPGTAYFVRCAFSFSKNIDYIPAVPLITKSLLPLPVVVNINYTEAIINITKCKQNSNHYAVHYKMLENSFEDWKAVDGKNYLSNNTVKITDLKADTSYVVVCGLSNNGTFLPQMHFTTNCDYLKANDLHIQLYSTTAQIVSNKPNKNVCQSLIKVTANCYHEWCLTNSTGEFILSTQPYELENLYPFSQYVFTVHLCKDSNHCPTTFYLKNLKTKADIPHAPKYVSTYFKNTTTISLYWKPPYPPTGVVSLYKVKYYNKISKEKTVNVSSFSCPARPEFECYTLTNLKPNNTYHIKIQTLNKGLDKFGEETTVTETTMSEPPVPQESSLGFILLISVSIGFVVIVICIIALRVIFKANQLKPKSNVEDIPLNRGNVEFSNHYAELESSVPPVRAECKNIELSKFKNYFFKLLSSGDINDQHKTIFQYAENKTYKSLIFFWNFIDLKLSENDYFKKAYLIAELPNVSKAKDFWNLLWTNNVQNAVIIDNVENTQCQKRMKRFWPDLNQILKIGNYKVAHVGKKLCDNYAEEVFEITLDNKTKKIKALHYLSWLENNIGYTNIAMVEFVRKVSKMSLQPASPVLFLSSVEGAGFALLCDMCVRSSKNGINILGNARLLAACNINLVSNLKSYIMAHATLLEVLLFPSTGIKCVLLKTDTGSFTNEDKLLQLTYIRELSVLDEKIRMTKQQFEMDDQKYTYIDTPNLVVIPGYKPNQIFIVSPEPTRFSLSNLWKDIFNNNISVIIALNSSKTSSWYPSENHPEIWLSATLLAQVKTIKQLRNYKWITVQLSQSQNEKKLTVHLFWFQDWSCEYTCPNHLSTFLEFYLETSKIVSNFNSAVVTCSDGKTASALYVAFSRIIAKIRVEDVCDICTAVRLVRSEHHEFLRKEEQVKFLWVAVEEFVRLNRLYELA